MPDISELPASSIAAMIDRGCRLMPPAAPHSPAGRLAALLDARAWLDAALALIEIEAPGWQLRRIDRDDDAWNCVLTRYPSMPPEFDEPAEGRHRLLPLAVLAAIADAAGRQPAPDNRATGRPLQPSESALCENLR